MTINIADAINSLRPTSNWILRGDVYAEIEWLDNINQKPTEIEVQAEFARLKADYDAKEYQRKRAKEYPPMTDYLDGIAKGDQAQIDKYIADCQAVKAKYPKG